ncbi:hypothetical protein GCM10023336_56400 [Streptomyces similanensis]|uniref:Uncharacterized protein n=2 Tax=Streptomyces similanensis TaxID=1274988 RepID=A0ABP9L8K2_9ACTN
MARLRLHAEARDWVVVDEVVDQKSTAAPPPLGLRPNWVKVKAYVGSGQAQGIVATAHTLDASDPTLTEWLHDQHAFLSEEAPTSAGTAR